MHSSAEAVSGVEITTEADGLGIVPARQNCRGGGGVRSARSHHHMKESLEMDMVVNFTVRGHWKERASLCKITWALGPSCQQLIDCFTYSIIYSEMTR